MSKLFFIGVIILGLANCNTTEPPPTGEKPTLILELDDAHCTEAWIILKTEKLTLPAELTLKQYNLSGDSISQIFLLNTKDSLIYIDSLLPNKSYRYQVSSIMHQVTSCELSVTTMDTTSHNFTFEMITFGGEISSSVLYDVAIINENNIWAVGDIWIKSDTSQTGYIKYNAVHWDGLEWRLLRIPNYDYGGYLAYGPIQTIFAFGENDIWLCSYANLVNYNGNTFNSKAFFMTDTNFKGQALKMWGINSESIYIVGRNGAIYYYFGTGWRKIQSHTTLNINDIWGDYNTKTKEWEILAVGSDKFFNEGSTVLKIEGLTSKELNKVGLPWSLSTVWLKSTKKYFIGGDGLYINKKINESWSKDTSFVPIYKDRIRGININDIVVSGSNGLLSHFNGYSWKHYINNELPYYSGRLLSVDIKQNVTVAVGWIGSKAIITIGRR